MMSASSDLRRIASHLTRSQRYALSDVRHPGLMGLRPYDNLSDDVGFVYDPHDENEVPEYSGRDLDALHRLGLAQAIAVVDTLVVFGGEHEEVGELEATHRWTITELGLSVLALVREAA